MFPGILRAARALYHIHARHADVAKFTFSASKTLKYSTTVIKFQEISKDTSPQNSELLSESRHQRKEVEMPLRSKVIESSHKNGMGKPYQIDTDKSIRIQNTKSSSGNSPGDNPSKSDYKPEVIRELPGDEKEDVLFNTLFGVRFIELNRPSKHNTLSSSMIRKIVPRLQEWAKSDMANIVIIKGCGQKAFCAGGDVVELVKLNRMGEEGQKQSNEYFALEYKLDHLIATYTKPYVAFMDGYTMGGGAGLCMHAPIRIATERTVFAMPETKIGFFPDVGASFFLPRLNGSIGTYLALTGERLEGVNAFYAGVATHYVHSSSLYPLELRLAELRFKDYDSLEERLDLIDSTIEEFVTGLPHDQPMIISGERRKAIDRCFNKGSIISIISALKAENGINKAWAEETLQILSRHSPTSLCVTLRLMQIGKKWTIAEAFQREHALAARFMQKSDFNEGVDELLISKLGEPKWDPPLIKDVKSEAEITEPYFQTDGIQPLKLLNGDDYPDYPHNKYRLPSEEAVKEALRGPNRDISKVVDYFLKKSAGKQGVKEVVYEIFKRNTTDPGK
ncbi:3-hydroxyisobutyryl-CoA hydrolase, mitochondrial [Golovinomyces cichoracearum]|uniref:3-hydroxyisobutyryl-CoA hydrolase n=1 Tax=Golovinomyces cichoracearum TaxID=62708 RepID=A0A420IGE0_9PEZI|nr:3-hydroxyisobutyryl-CoA hydrolase, mitochondrial [Golovinomyces cichoracearum]